jgi:hypothetical protein
MATVIMTIPFEQLGVVDAEVLGRPVGHQTYRNVTQLQASNNERFDHSFTEMIPMAKPSVPQFSGTLGPAIEGMAVSLRRANRGVLETARTDVNGYFEFVGWYYPHADYEFVIQENALYQTRVFPVNAPIAHRWNGAPDRYDSTSFV